MVIVARQGDVAFIRRDKPDGGEQINRVGGRLILAEGEATGHAHAVQTAGAELWQVGGETFLLVPDGGATVEVVHEEVDRQCHEHGGNDGCRPQNMR